MSKKKERFIKRESHIRDMRVKTSLTGRGLIPFNYNLALAGAVYGAVKRVNTELASQIHSNTGYKYFTFSLLQIPERRISPEGIYVEDGCFFLVSSPVRDVISSFVEGIMERPEVRIDRVQFEVEGVEMMRSPELDRRCVFSTLSPIIVRSVKQENGKKRIIDLYPTDTN